MTVEISSARPDRVPLLAAMLGRAFADDPMIRWPFPAGDDEEAERRTTEMFRVIDERFAEAGWLWEAGDVAGVALWIPPGGDAFYVQVERDTRDAIDALTDDGGARYRAFWDWIEEHFPHEPHWYLDHLAVAPEHRAKGFGRALIELGLGFARRDGVPAFLETARPANVRYYERLGFAVVVEEAAPGGGPPLWFMRFEP